MFDIESEEKNIYEKLNQIEKEIKQRYIDHEKVIKLIVELQRDIEYLNSQIDYPHTSKNSDFLNRINKNIKNIVHLIESRDKIGLFSKYRESGLIPVVEQINDTSYNQDTL